MLSMVYIDWMGWGNVCCEKCMIGRKTVQQCTPGHEVCDDKGNISYGNFPPVTLVKKHSWLCRRWGVQVANSQNMWKGGWWWPRYDPPTWDADATDLCFQAVRRLISPQWMRRRYRTMLVLFKILWLLMCHPQQKEPPLQMIPSAGAWRPTLMNSE